MAQNINQSTNHNQWYATECLRDNRRNWKCCFVSECKYTLILSELIPNASLVWIACWYSLTLFQTYPLCEWQCKFNYFFNIRKSEEAKQCIDVHVTEKDSLGNLTSEVFKIAHLFLTKKSALCFVHKWKCFFQFAHQ